MRIWLFIHLYGIAHGGNHYAMLASAIDNAAPGLRAGDEDWVDLMRTIRNLTAPPIGIEEIAYINREYLERNFSEDWIESKIRKARKQ